MNQGSFESIGHSPVVLFLCTGNSARSQMAEAFLRHHAGGTFDAHSAGLEPNGINPFTHRVMAEVGIDTSKQRSKSSADYLGKVSVRHAVIVCEKANQHCPRIYPFATRTHYWPFEDPAAVEGTDEEKLEAFRNVRDHIEARIRQWLRELEQAP